MPKPREQPGNGVQPPPRPLPPACSHILGDKHKGSWCLWVWRQTPSLKQLKAAVFNRESWLHWPSFPPLLRRDRVELCLGDGETPGLGEHREPGAAGSQRTLLNPAGGGGRGGGRGALVGNHGGRVSGSLPLLSSPLAPPSAAHGACPCVRTRPRTVHLRTCVSVSEWSFR